MNDKPKKAGDDVSAGGGTKAIVAALGANLGIAVTKFVAFGLTGSSSMLAEGIHSVADSGNQALLLVGAKRAKRQATPEHPFGYGRERYIYAFIVAIVLFSVGGLFAIYEGYHKIHDTLADVPNQMLESKWWWVPLVVLTIAIGLETFSFKTAITESNHVRGKASWRSFIRNSKAPELPVVLLEDLAALLGLILALCGVGLTLLTKNGIYDGIFTVAIGVLLVVVAVILAFETKSLLLGEAATKEHVAAIEKALVGEEVDHIIHMKTLHLGPEELLVAAKIAVRGTDSAADIARGIDSAERRVRAAVPDIRCVIYLEPDIDRAAAAK